METKLQAILDERIDVLHNVAGKVDDLVSAWRDVTITDPDDEDGIARAKEARRVLGAARKSIHDKRLELTEDARAFHARVNDVGKELTGQIDEVLDPIKAQLKAVEEELKRREREAAERERRKVAERIQRLAEVRAVVDVREVETWSDTRFARELAEHTRIHEEREAEAERQRKELEELRRVKAEAEAREREAEAARAREREAELEEQRKAQEAERKKLQEERDRFDAERREHEAKVAAERREREREEKRKADEEAKAKADAEAEARRTATREAMGHDAPILREIAEAVGAATMRARGLRVANWRDPLVALLDQASAGIASVLARHDG